MNISKPAFSFVLFTHFAFAGFGQQHYLERHVDTLPTGTIENSEWLACTNYVFEDFDNDGDLDLMLERRGKNFFSHTDLGILHYENNGKGEFTLRKDDYITASEYNKQVYLKDINDDGLNDVFIFEGSTVQIYEKDSSLNLTRKVSQGISNIGSKHIWLEDFNHDGYLDLILGKTYLSYARFDPTDYTFDYLSANRGGSNMIPIDINNNGRTDFLHGNDLYRQTSSGYTKSTISLPIGMGNEGYLVGDFDGDGFEDIMTFFSYKGPELLINNQMNTGFIGSFSVSGIPFFHNLITTRLRVEDIDRNGTNDVLTYFGWFLNKGFATYEKDTGRVFDLIEQSNPRFLDLVHLNQDTLLDLFLASGHGPVSSTEILFGSAGPTTYSLGHTKPVIQDNGALVDVKGSKQADLVTTNNLYWSDTNGTKHITPLNTGLKYIHNAYTVDENNDGLLDIFIHGQEDDPYTFKLTSALLMQSPTGGFSLSYLNNKEQFIGKWATQQDIDGDGLKDIIVEGKFDFLKAMPSATNNAYSKVLTTDVNYPVFKFSQHLDLDGKHNKDFFGYHQSIYTTFVKCALSTNINTLRFIDIAISAIPWNDDIEFYWGDVDFDNKKELAIVHGNKTQGHEVKFYDINFTTGNATFMGSLKLKSICKLVFMDINKDGFEDLISFDNLYTEVYINQLQQTGILYQQEYDQFKGYYSGYSNILPDLNVLTARVIDYYGDGSEFLFIRGENQQMELYKSKACNNSAPIVTVEPDKMKCISPAYNHKWYQCAPTREPAPYSKHHTLNYANLKGSGFLVEVVNSKGCKSSSGCNPIYTNGINSSLTSTNNNIWLYPNPTNTISVNVSGNSLEKVHSYEVFNSAGNLLNSKAFKLNEPIKINEEPGMYIVRFRLTNNTYQHVKMIKQ